MDNGDNRQHDVRMVDQQDNTGNKFNSAQYALHLVNCYRGPKNCSICACYDRQVQNKEIDEVMVSNLMIKITMNNMQMEHYQQRGLHGRGRGRRGGFRGRGRGGGYRGGGYRGGGHCGRGGGHHGHHNEGYYQQNRNRGGYGYGGGFTHNYIGGNGYDDGYADYGYDDYGVEDGDFIDYYGQPIEAGMSLENQMQWVDCNQSRVSGRLRRNPLQNICDILRKLPNVKPENVTKYSMGLLVDALEDENKSLIHLVRVLDVDFVNCPDRYKDFIVAINSWEGTDISSLVGRGGLKSAVNSHSNNSSLTPTTTSADAASTTTSKKLAKVKNTQFPWRMHHILTYGWFLVNGWVKSVPGFLNKKGLYFVFTCFCLQTTLFFVWCLRFVR